MNAPLGSADFFALEAGECLDRLEVLITSPDAADPAQMLRYARALRGSALMANQTAIARTAAGFEALARAVRDGKRLLDAVARERAGQAVDDTRHLVRRVKEWTAADDARANRIASELAALAGGDIPDPRHPPAPSLASQTGVRAFVGREGALVASALDRAARALEDTPDAREPLYAVLRRMQSLRGLAELTSFSPLPEVLDGIELAVGDLTRIFAPPPAVPQLLDAGARALTRVSRDVAEHGQPDPDPPEAREFTERLLRAFASEDDVIPIEHLLDGRPTDAITRSDAQPQFAPPTPLGAVELVSHGEHLGQAAMRIEDAPSGTARDLRLYALVPALRSVETAGRDALSVALGRFARGACRTIASGEASHDPSAFAHVLRSAGSLLRRVADTGPTASIASELRRLADELASEPAGEAVEAHREAAPVTPPVATPAGPAPRIVDIEDLAYDGEPIQAVSAAPAGPRTAEVPAPVPEPAPAPAPSERAGPPADDVVGILDLEPADPLPLERAFTRYRELQRTTAQATPEVIDIRALCYSGRRALERAAEVRSEIAVVMGPSADLPRLEPLLAELLDLVPLALDGA